MKKFAAVPVIIAAIIALIILASSLYIVDQSQQAVVTQFGKPVRVIINPIEGRRTEEVLNRLSERYEQEGVAVAQGAGLRLKIPFIQRVRRFERRLLRWNGAAEEIPTKDKKYIWVDTTARWYIEDPLLFLRSVGTEQQAHTRLDDVIDATTRNSITKRNLIEIVRTDNRPMQVAEEELQETTKVGQVEEGRSAIIAEITREAQQGCQEYGIGIHSSGILLKGLTYVESVKEEVEQRMIQERMRIAKMHTSEGEGEYERIMGDKEREVKTILSEAYRTAKEIEGQADANAVEIYAKGFGKDPEFYRFWKTLELYEESIVGQKTRLILGTDNPLFEMIKGDVQIESMPKVMGSSE